MQQNYADFIASLQRAIDINPNKDEAHNNLAILLDDQFSDYEGAKEHYERAIAINPSDTKAYYNLAILLKDQFSDSNNAKKHYLKAIELNPALRNKESDKYFGV